MGWEDDLMIQELISGCDQAFAKVYHTYHRQAYTYLLRRTDSVALAEELLQLSFIKLWKNAQNLNPQIPLNAQLFRICRTVMLDEIKRLNSLRNMETDYAAQSRLATEDNAALNRHLSEDIQAAISALPPARKRIFVLSRLEGYSHKEIAEMMSISVRTVEDHMGKALKLLRRKLRDSILFFF